MQAWGPQQTEMGRRAEGERPANLSQARSPRRRWGGEVEREGHWASSAGKQSEQEQALAQLAWEVQAEVRSEQASLRTWGRREAPDARRTGWGQSHDSLGGASSANPPGHREHQADDPCPKVCRLQPPQPDDWWKGVVARTPQKSSQETYATEGVP